MMYAKLIGRIALFTCENIADIEFYLQGLLPKILAIYTIICSMGRMQCQRHDVNTLEKDLTSKRY